MKTKRERAVEIMEELALRNPEQASAWREHANWLRTDARREDVRAVLRMHGKIYGREDVRVVLHGVINERRP